MVPPALALFPRFLGFSLEDVHTLDNLVWLPTDTLEVLSALSGASLKMLQVIVKRAFG